MSPRATIRPPTQATPGVRQAGRARMMASILAAARQQLVTVGAAGVSLRLVARDIGVVSSAVYRYVASRDELLTLLIVEAYDSLGEAVEASTAGSAGQPFVDRWLAAAHAVRVWAIARPQEYLLLYGTPVPGYQAPSDTVSPGTRAPIALGRLLEGTRSARRNGAGVAVDTALADDLAATIRLEIEPAAMVAFVAAWAQLFGLVTFELTNQTRGIAQDHRALFDAAVRHSALSFGRR